MPKTAEQITFEDDSEAVYELRKDRRFSISQGWISPAPGVTPNAREHAAIDYLCGEWDYGWLEQRKEG